MEKGVPLGQRLLCFATIAVIAFTMAAATAAMIVYVLHPQSTQTEFTDEEILDAVYSDYKYPEGFYQEDLQGASLYYENTVSTMPFDERENNWIELCTDNRSQALEWSESSSRYSAYYRELVDERETEKFFEFKRVYSEYPSDILLSRVHKCSYLNRSQYDLLNPGPVLGTFNQRPVTIENVNELVEYLWFKANCQMGGAKVLSSFTESQGNSIKHTIYETQVVYGDWGLSDAITLSKSEYTVDKNSGVITLSKENVKVVEGRHHDSVLLTAPGLTHVKTLVLTVCSPCYSTSGEGLTRIPVTNPHKLHAR